MARVDKGESVKYSAFTECEIIHSVNCEISPVADGLGRCEMKFAFSHLRSKYFTAELFHMAEPYFTRRRRISLKKAHIVLVDKCVLFSGGEGEIIWPLRGVAPRKYSRPARACVLKFNGKGREKRFELYSMRAQTLPFLELRAMLRHRRNARGATFAH